ncbi:hypothetical protein SH611_22835 [Geminicoccaceae bacterium 1502E]|nr:hypothetical protein [Geminicoccaceae bacterium 1502E]
MLETQILPPEPPSIRAEVRERPVDFHQRLIIHFSWRSLGQVTVRRNGALRLPEVTSAPGLFRLRIGSGASMVQLLGETASLRRRFATLARAVPSASKGLAATIHAALAAGEPVALDIVTGGVIEPLYGRARAACLADRNERQLILQASRIELLQTGFSVETVR